MRRVQGVFIDSLKFRMRNPWIFGIAFFAVVFYMAANFFELPVIFWGETDKTTGKIFDIKVIPDGGGRYQKIYYWYYYQDSLYVGSRQIGKTFGRQSHGNRILIQLATSNPAKHRAYGSYNDFRNDRKYRFLHVVDSAQKIVLVNGIAKILFEKNERVLYGEYKILSDSSAQIQIWIPNKMPKQIYEFKANGSVVKIR